MIKNLQTIFVLFLFSAISLAILPMLGLIKNLHPRIKKVYFFFVSLYFWNGSLTFFFESYIEMIISCLINLEYIIRLDNF